MRDTVSTAPRKKILAAGAGAGIAAPLGIILVWAIEEFHNMPTEVDSAVVALLVALASVVSGYLMPESTDAQVTEAPPNQGPRK